MKLKPDAIDKELYPPVGFHFKVEFKLQGLSAEAREARFQEVSGLSKSLGVEEYREGGENRFSHRLPLPAKYPNLVLKRGVLRNSKLIKWCFDAIDNFVFSPVELTVTLLNEEHDPLVVWDFVGAYPVKWSVTDLKAQENSIVIESMELVYQYFTKKDA